MVIKSSSGRLLTIQSCRRKVGVGKQLALNITRLWGSINRAPHCSSKASQNKAKEIYIYIYIYCEVF
ncbi:hypothetical protein F511_24465 [Dorcoceras hygrometricum]|uniref:Uncharacterized protein n=1 Tax=Dorcoceras hygrometricum TaxID=472368 RepID=A0A2Z7A739_9LAMI|nr:hypothetical protein F511_41857 [Dorcoceras hygrometricum]KZV41931.1 hypothetical protein F511_24465 [Dorcoceras hygrometricum]